MAELKMTALRFAKAKLANKSTADAYINKHRDFLNKFEFLSEILSSYDSKEIYPTAALQLCQIAMTDHVIASKVKTAEHEISKSAKMSALGIVKRADLEKKEKPQKDSGYKITIMVKKYDRDGNVTGEEIGTIDKRSEDDNGKVLLSPQEAIFNEKDYGAAERKADRMLFSMQNSLYALIENCAGEKIATPVQRGDAIARMLKTKSPMASKRIASSGGSMKPQMRARNDSCSFSRG